MKRVAGGTETRRKIAFHVTYMRSEWTGSWSRSHMVAL